MTFSLCFHNVTPFLTDFHILLVFWSSFLGSTITRRALLTQLCQQGTSRVTDLANYYDMSLNAVSKHIKILEKAGLVTRKTIGRTHWIEANLEQISVVDDWFKELKFIWEIRLEKLNEILNNGEAKND